MMAVPLIDRLKVDDPVGVVNMTPYLLSGGAQCVVVIDRLKVDNPVGAVYL